MNKISKINPLPLALLITSAVDGISNLPSIALFGLHLVFFFLLASLVFLIPTSLITGELCTQYDADSGVYVWTKAAFGPNWGAGVIWLQWINTLVWFPTCLTTFVGTVAYLIDPALAQRPLYLILSSLTIFWLMTVLNFKGVKLSTQLASLATSIGMIFPMFIIIALSILWIILEKPLAISAHHVSLLPPLLHLHSWNAITAIIAAFLGIELASVHVKHIANAKTVFPKALIYATLMIIATMGIGSLCVALVIPHQHIVLVTGAIQALSALFIGLHLSWLQVPFGLLLICGLAGAMINWLISPANGLAQAAQDHYLPPFLARLNQHDVPKRILVLQGVIVSVISTAFFFMPSINGAYWLLLDMATELYVIMYILMFAAAICLLFKAKKIHLIPGGKKVALGLAAIGLCSCMIVFCIGFIPPTTVNVGSAWHYIGLLSGGLILLMIPAGLMIHYKARSIHKHQ